MKKVILIAAIILFTGFNGLVAQNYTINPIPSFNVPLSTTNTAFQEVKTKGIPGREKRDMEVEISTSSTSTASIFATVWVVKKNSAQILGPYTIYPEEPLTVPIDAGEWGTVINCQWNVTASVWID